MSSIFAHLLLHLTINRPYLIKFPIIIQICRIKKYLDFGLTRKFYLHYFNKIMTKGLNLDLTPYTRVIYLNNYNIVFTHYVIVYNVVTNILPCRPPISSEELQRRR